MSTAIATVDPAFDRFDICEAHYLVESYYNVGGWLRERPSNARRHEATSAQLARIKFKPAPSLDYATLTENGKAIFLALINRLNLPEWTAEDAAESEAARR